MDYVVGSVAALLTGNVTPNRPKKVKKPFTPMKHQPSPNVTPKSELVEDRSIFLSPSVQKKKAIVKKSPKRIFQNPDLDVTQDEANVSLTSPKADKVKKHLKDQLDANTGVDQIMLSPKSPKEEQAPKSPGSKKKLDIGGEDINVNESPKKKKKKRNSKSESKALPIDSKNLENEKENLTANIETEQNKNSSPKKKEHRSKSASENVESKPTPVSNTNSDKPKNKRKKKNKQQNNTPKVEIEKPVTEESTQEPATEQKSPKKKNKRKKNKQAKTETVNENSENVNQNAVTNKDTDSEHESDDEIESDSENQKALEPAAEASSDEEEEPKKEEAKKETPAPTEDEIKRTIFVGNVPFSKKCKKEIKKIFSQFGQIDTVRIRTIPVKDARVTPKLAVIKNELHPDRTTVNVYVKFADEASVNKALAANNTVLNEHHLRVSRSDTTGAAHDPKSSIFVGNIPFGLEDEGLRAKFAKCGEIESVRIIRDKKTNAGKGFGYVNFTSKDGVELALALTEEDLTIKNRILRVKRCTQPTQKKFVNKQVGNQRQNQGKFGKNRFGNQNDERNDGAYRRLQNKRKHQDNNEGPPNKKQNLNQPQKDKKTRKEFVGITAEKKKKQKLNKGQKKKKVLSEILTKK